MLYGTYLFSEEVCVTFSPYYFCLIKIYKNIPHKFLSLFVNNKFVKTITNKLMGGILAMYRKNLKKKIICGLLVGSMALSVGITASASSVSRFEPEKSNTEMNAAQAENKHNKVFEGVIEELVKEGKLSKEKADAIEDYLEKKKEERESNPEASKGKHNIFGEMITKGIITEQEASIIKDKFYEIKEKKLDEKLSKLVDKKVLTEKNVKDIKNYLKAYRENKKAEFEKMNNMSEEQKKQYLENIKKEMKNPFDEMVEKKIITKEQAEEVKKALHNHGHKGDKKHECKPEKETKENKDNKDNKENREE